MVNSERQNKYQQRKRERERERQLVIAHVSSGMCVRRKVRLQSKLVERDEKIQ